LINKRIHNYRGRHGCRIISEKYLMNVTRLDHLVLTVNDLEATSKFYAMVLGMKVVTFGENRKTLTFGSQRINLHQAGHELEPKAHRPTPGSADLCFLADVSSEEVVAHLNNCGIMIVLGPVSRTGGAGTLKSVYFRDPDLNLIEVACLEQNEGFNFCSH
jgi:catechol 2,3-dioxygenase-like lactoylglutathione lyase family enzyme